MDELRMAVYLAADLQWRGTSQECLQCGFSVDSGMPWHTKEQAKEHCQQARNYVGERCQWTTRKISYTGQILSYVPQQVNLYNHVSAHHPELVRETRHVGKLVLEFDIDGNKTSKFPRYVIECDNGKFVAINTRQAKIIP